MELGHFDKHFVKNITKKDLTGKHFRVFYPTPGSFFPKSAHFRLAGKIQFLIEKLYTQVEFQNEVPSPQIYLIRYPYTDFERSTYR